MKPLAQVEARQHDQQTLAMLDAEMRAGKSIDTKSELEVRLGTLRASLLRNRAYLRTITRDIDGILGELPADDDV